VKDVTRFCVDCRIQRKAFAIAFRDRLIDGDLIRRPA
jgi:hypothetical protein